MVKLYYTKTSCGASSFISAFIAGLNLECEIVDLATHTTDSGANFYDINPKGNVPSLVLDDGTVLNENIACLEYIANETRQSNLAPQHGTTERYVLLQVLSYIASELHASIGGFFNPASKDPVIREFLLNKFEQKMNYVQNNLLSGGRTYVVGDSFTTADAYLHIVFSWLGYIGLDLSNYPVAQTYYNRICELPGVMAAKDRMRNHPKTIL
jgi:glutathione S-transferase